MVGERKAVDIVGKEHSLSYWCQVEVRNMTYPLCFEDGMLVHVERARC